MTPQEIRTEMSRVRTALRDTDSPYLRRDYGKYLKRLKSKLYEAERKRDEDCQN